MKVWDRPVRVLHWTLVVSVALAAITALTALSFGETLHQAAGWVAVGVVLARLSWSRLGSRHARFGSFVRPPRATLAYARALLQRREPRHLGHNPLGGWMIVALLACIAGLALTGWLYTSDWLWGNETVEAWHLALSWTLLALVLLHLGGVLFTSLRHRENLVRAMFSGRKRDPAPGDID